MYETAENVASDSINREYSEKMIDELLANNGYSKKVLQTIKTERLQKKSRKSKSSSWKNDDKKSILKLPFLSDKCTAQIRQAATKHKIPVRVVTTPGTKLKNLLTSSKPLDKPQCPNIDCKTCDALTTKGQCTDRNLIYHMSCGIDSCTSKNIGKYDGETYRPLDDRYTEHYRSAKNPSAKSYADKPWAKHYAAKHPECKEPKISVSIVD